MVKLNFFFFGRSNLTPYNIEPENAITTLKEFGEHGKCSIPEYDLPGKQVYEDSKLYWKCTCHVNDWGISKILYATPKKEAKKYAAYLVLCEHYNIPAYLEGNVKIVSK